jgi:hypothetical protein
MPTPWDRPRTTGPAEFEDELARVGADGIRQPDPASGGDREGGVDHLAAHAEPFGHLDDDRIALRGGLPLDDP